VRQSSNQWLANLVGRKKTGKRVAHVGGGFGGRALGGKGQGRWRLKEVSEDQRGWSIKRHMCSLGYLETRG